MQHSMQWAEDSQLQHGQGLLACPMSFVMTAAGNIRVCLGHRGQSAAP